MESESNVLVSNQKQIRKANRLLLEMTETFSENNIVQAKSIYERILSSSTNDNATSTITAQKMLRLLAVLENYLVGAHRNNKADIHNVADVLYYNRFYFNDCYKDLIEELDEAIFYWYDKAALLGSASAYLKRARLLLYGRGVKQSMEEALDSYNKANEGSKDALEVWTSVKNDKVPTRADLADEVNVIKFYLFSEGLFNYEQNYEKAKEILSHLSNASLVKSLSALLTNKIENNKAKIIDKSILAKSQEYEDLKNDITEINEQIKEAERRKHEISSVLENAKSNMANAQDILNRMNEEIADKEKNIVTLAHRLQEMESEENTLSKSCSSKRNELTSLEGQIQELGQKYKKMADDCAALEMKYATFKEYEDVNQINSGKCEIDADNGNVETQYKQKLYFRNNEYEQIDLTESYVPSVKLEENLTFVSVAEQEEKMRKGTTEDACPKAIEVPINDERRKRFKKKYLIILTLISIFLVFYYVIPLFVPPAKDINHFIKVKNQFDYKIIALASDINNYTETHADFKNANELLERGKNISSEIEKEKQNLQNAKIDNKALKEQLIIVLELESERINGLVNGMIDSKSGKDYLPQFKKGTHAAFRFDEEDAKLQKMNIRQ